MADYHLLIRLRTFGAFSMDDDGNLSEFHPNPLTSAAANEIDRLAGIIKFLLESGTDCYCQIDGEEIMCAPCVYKEEFSG